MPNFSSKQSNVNVAYIRHKSRVQLSVYIQEADCTIYKCICNLITCLLPIKVKVQPLKNLSIVSGINTQCTLLLLNKKIANVAPIRLT